MKAVIYTGDYRSRRNPLIPSWQDNALILQKDWCKRQGVRHQVIGDNCMRAFGVLGAFGLLDRFPDSWTFGTLTMFLAVHDFVRYGQADRFIWMDLDIIPDHRATIDMLLEPGVHYGNLSVESASNYQIQKLCWSFAYRVLIDPGSHQTLRSELAVSTMLFTLDRAMAESFLKWLEEKFEFLSLPFFVKRYRMQSEASVVCLEAYDRCYDRPHFGCDESYFEIFANLLHAQGRTLPLLRRDIWTNVGDGDAPFVHYYGQNKSRILEL